MSYSQFLYSVKSWGVEGGFVITQYDRTTNKEVNSVVMDDTYCIPNTLPNDELHNYLHRYNDSNCDTIRVGDTTIYRHYMPKKEHVPKNIGVALTMHDNGSILKVENYGGLQFVQDNDDFEKVDPRIFITPSLWRYILFTRPAPRGKYFCNSFIENEKF